MSIVAKKYKEAVHFFHELEKNSFNQAIYEANLSAFINSTRNISYAIQKDGKGKSGFEDWWEEKRSFMRGDELMKFFYELRNFSVKEADNKVSSQSGLSMRHQLSFDGKGGCIATLKSRDGQIIGEKISKYKFKKLSTEAFKNGVRLHFDSILLFNNESYPSAFQLSILAMEEFSKSNQVEHYYWSSITNNGFPDEEFEQKWFILLYFYSRKQTAFFGWGYALDYSPKFVKFVQDKKLESKKQHATYVGLDRNKSKIDVKSRISIPSRIKEKDAKQMISLINAYLSEICRIKMIHEDYFDIEEKDELLTSEFQQHINEWEFKSGLRSNRWFSEWMNNMKKAAANKA